MTARRTFTEAERLGRAGENLAEQHFSAAGWQVRRIKREAQKRGAGDLRIECPRSLIVAEVEVKTVFAEGPCCPVELATHGSRPRASGILGSTAEQVLFIQAAARTGYLYRRVELEQLVGVWLRAFCPIWIGDEGSSTRRLVLMVPWPELGRSARVLDLSSNPAAPLLAGLSKE